LANTDFGKYFRFALYDYKSLAIPGLGMINLQRNSAFVDLENYQVYPPKYDIKFLSDVSVSNHETFGQLRSYLPELTRSDFDSYMNTRVTELNATGQTMIEGVGLLTRNQGEVTFLPYAETTNLLTYGLNRLGLNKISNFIQAKQMDEVKSLPSESSFWFLFLPLLIAALLLASSIAYLNREGIVIPNQKSNITISSPINKDTIYNVEKIDTTTNNVEKIDTTTNNVEKIDTTTKAIIGREAIVSDIIKNSDGSYIKKCIIITGAFKSAKYQNLMIERLKENGYDVFTEKKGRLTRVGLQFECHEKDLEKYLQAVRETLDKDAWYLDELANKEG
jgi:predicted transcriptional regulator